MRQGQRSYIPGIGYIAITCVEPVELALLTDADAILDGFPSAELLRAELHTLYTPDVIAKMTPYRIRFSVYPPREQQRFAKERQKKKKEQQKKNRNILPQDFVAQTLDKLQKMSETETANCES